MAFRGNRPKPIVDKLVRGNPGHRPLTTMVPAPRAGAILCPAQVVSNETAKAYWEMYLANAAPGQLLAAVLHLVAGYVEARPPRPARGPEPGNPH